MSTSRGARRGPKRSSKASSCSRSGSRTRTCRLAGAGSRSSLADVETGTPVGTEPGTEADAPPEAPTDDLRSGLVAAFEAEFGDALVGSHLRPGDDVWVRGANDAWSTAAEWVRSKLGFQFFDYLSAIDWMPSPFGRYEDAEV